MSVHNHGGAKTLRITFTIISERPIVDRSIVEVKCNDVVLPSDPVTYQVAEVCLKNISTNRLMFFRITAKQMRLVPELSE